MTKKEFKKRVIELPSDKRVRITELLREAYIKINSIKCELHHTSLEGVTFLEIRDNVSLSNILFKNEQIFRL